MTDESYAFPEKIHQNVYPTPEHDFPNARIGITYETSVPDFPPPTAAPNDSPNVLLVLLDDVGFGWMETFGGSIKSPTLDRIAKRGLRYSAFHTTSLCSPTRAALLTGRNHHSVSSGVIQEQATGYPGYCGIIPQSTATIAEILSANGYATGWWGKNHNVPDNHTSPAGPFYRWPTQMGFDYFYGFISGETDQFYPTLYRGTTPVDPPSSPEEGYQLTRDIASDCVAWIRQQKAIAPDRPFFAYFAPGCAHAPHHPPLDWRGRNKGKFDGGWDTYREETYNRQIELGVIPSDAKLTPRPVEIPAWDEQPEEHQKLFSRFAENYADFLEHADFEVGQLVDAIEELGQLDNTLILYIVGDNGSSAEGSLTGTLNEVMNLNGVNQDIDHILARIDEIGLPGTSPHYPVGWAWASDCPFQWTKQVASHFGGTRNPMVVSWPARIADHGGVRFQFHHAIDVVPTILDVVGISQPSMFNGTPQKKIEGVSMAYTFDEQRESAPSTRTRQYFEMFGNRAIYDEGWLAACRHGRLPWVTAGSYSFDDDVWELYDLTNDFSEADDLAEQMPEKLRNMQDLFLVEAAKYNVLPLDDRFAERLDVTLRPSYFYGRKHVTFFPGMVRLPEGSGPKFSNVSHKVSVAIEMADLDESGVLFCVGGDTGGFSVFVENGKLGYHYNYFDVERYEARSKESIPTGASNLGFEFQNQTNKPGGPAAVNLLINEKVVGSLHVVHQTPNRFGIEVMDVGVDSLSPVSKTYPRGEGFAFTGVIKRVDIYLGDDALETSPEENLCMVLASD